MRYIVTNFAYGYGPFLRTTELALALNKIRIARGEPSAGIIVPLVYGDRQKQIMREEFANDLQNIFLDEQLGTMLKKVFYADSTYEIALRAWVENYERISNEARVYLKGPLTLTGLTGSPRMAHGSEIFLEIARAPRISYNCAPVYGGTFGHISEILEQVRTVDTDKISVDRTLIEKAIPLAQKLEKNQKIVGLANPGTFSYRPERTPLSNEVRIPPLLRMPRLTSPPIPRGIYLTVTGIPGLERLYEEARALGLTIYTNDAARIPGSVTAPPNIIGNPAILLHFARSGWGSVWGSQLLGKATVVPEFDPADDPEIYFNNICVEKLGLGLVYRNEPLQEIIERAEALEPGIKTLNQKILAEFGTFDGNHYLAKRIDRHTQGWRYYLPFK